MSPPPHALSPGLRARKQKDAPVLISPRPRETRLWARERRDIRNERLIARR
jgi:hypothetical protein